MAKENISKIITIMRIKDEERWIKKSLDSLEQFFSEVVILDDGSTDNTLEICKNHNSVVDIHKQKNLPFDETRDKNILLKMAMKRNPDFIFCIDGDQIVQPNIREILFEELDILHSNSSLFEFQNITMWDNPNQYRYDGLASNIWVRRLIRISKQPKDLQFQETNRPGNCHCPPVPQNSEGWINPIRSKIKIFHYGKFDEDLRQEKFKFLNKLEPNNTNLENYKHIISGEGKLSGEQGIELREFPEKMCPNVS